MITFKAYSAEYTNFFQELIEQLQDHIVSLDSHDRVIRHPNYGEYYVHTLLKQVKEQGGKIFLAFDGEKVVGMVAALILKRSFEDDLQLKPAKYGEIEELYVKNEYRDKGIGSTLFTMAEEYLINEEACDYVEVVVFGDNHNAHVYYEKLGYKDREYVMIKKAK